MFHAEKLKLCSPVLLIVCLSVCVCVSEALSLSSIQPLKRLKNKIKKPLPRTSKHCTRKQPCSTEKQIKSANKGVNFRSKCVTQVRQQRPESPTVTLTRHACKYKLHKLHQRCIPRKGFHPVAYIPYISGTLGDTGVHRHKTEPIFIPDLT